MVTAANSPKIKAHVSIAVIQVMMALYLASTNSKGGGQNCWHGNGIPLIKRTRIPMVMESCSVGIHEQVERHGTRPGLWTD